MREAVVVSRLWRTINTVPDADRVVAGTGENCFVLACIVGCFLGSISPRLHSYEVYKMPIFRLSVASSSVSLL